MAVSMGNLPADIDVITAQPQSDQSHSDRYYDGEEIIFEAKCDTKNLQSEIRSEFNESIALAFLAGAGLLPLAIWCCIAIPMGRYCGRRVSNSWRLCVTRSQIHHIRKHACCVCTSCDHEIHLDISDVSKVYIQSPVPEIRGQRISRSQQLGTCVVLELKEGCREDLQPHFLCMSCNYGPTTIRFNHCTNAEEFVRAVQFQMQH